MHQTLRYAIYVAVAMIGAMVAISGQSQAALAATVTVTSTADSVTPNDGSVTLREAITSINAGNDLGDPNISAQNPGTYGVSDTINFDIPGVGVHTITYTSAMPAIFKPVTINGFSQSGASPNTLAVGDNAVILIELDVFAQGNGLMIESGGVTIRGLSIGRAVTVGVHVGSGTDARIAGNRIGLRADGTTGLGNIVGIRIDDPAAATIGGPDPGDRNTISGSANGIAVATTASGVTILNNYIGTNAAGTAARANNNGVLLSTEPSGIRIGAAGAGNLISGNVQAGVFLACITCPSSSPATIQANLIGTDATGTGPIPNIVNGILIGSGAGFVIGTDSDGTNDDAEGNVISGNGDFGVRFQGINTTNPITLTLAGNKIGTTAAGDAALPNASGGILWKVVKQGPSLIGGPSAAARNLISGNTGPGIEIRESVPAGITGDLTIQNNLIGTNAAGTGPLPNTGPGISTGIEGATRVRIGGAGATDANTIMFNGGAGVLLSAGSDITISRNKIGQNTGLGIDLGTAGVTLNDAGDGDTGANALQNFPVLTGVTVGNSVTSVSGTLNSTANSQFRVELFASAACDGSGNGEGDRFLGTANVSTDGGGNGTFALGGLPSVALTERITATATATGGNQNTSEFSACATPVAAGATATPSGGLVTTEAGGQANFSVVLTSQPSTNVTIPASSSNTAEGTVSPVSLTFTPANWNVAQNVTVTGVDDAVADGAVAYTIVLGMVTTTDPAYANLDPADVSASNTDNEGPAGLSVADAGAAEASGTLTFTVSMAPASGSAVTVAYATSNGTATGGASCATAGVDFLIASGSLNFAPGDTSLPIPVTLCNDTLVENPETISLTLSNSTDGTTITRATATGTITDDDVAGGIAFASASTSVQENAGSVSLAVQRSGGTASGATVHYNTVNGTAKLDTDYTGIFGVLNFGAGETTKTITIPILNDTLSEPSEAFTVVLSNPAGGATLGSPATATVTVNDDDLGGTIAFDPTTATVGENGGTVTLTVRRTGGAASGVTVQFATGDGTAKAGSDYSATSGTLTFGANETTKTIAVPIISDFEVEANEAFTVTLSNPQGGAALGTAKAATVTVSDTSPGPPIGGGDDDTDHSRQNTRDSKDTKETEEEQQQRERTNKGNKDDVHTEGNVVEVHQDELPPYVIIGNKDGLVRVNLLCKDQCPTIKVGDYVEAEGEKQNEALFDATDISTKR